MSFCGEVLQHPVWLGIIAKMLLFFIGAIAVGVVIYIIAWFQDEEVDVLVLHITKGVFIEVVVVSIEGNYLISGC